MNDDFCLSIFMKMIRFKTNTVVYLAIWVISTSSEILCRWQINSSVVSKNVVEAEIISIQEVESTFLNKQHTIYNSKIFIKFRVNGIEILWIWLLGGN